MTSCTSTKPKPQKKMEAWIHLHPNNLKTFFQDYKEFGKRSKEAGYTTIVVRFTNPYGYDKKLAKELLNYYRKELGLIIVPEFKLLGKSHKTFSKKFIKKHPELFVGNVIDPYAIYNGKPAYDSLIIPMVDEHIELFENPDYFMLGWDETHPDNIKKVAERNKKTISEVWAGTLNKVTDYLISKNITPMIFGDQLLSKKLANADNPVGYPGDKRFETSDTCHSIFPSYGKTDLIGYVKDIRNREKIIVLDWHYNNKKEYPSVDYFKWLGFKDVIPVTWGNEENMKYFSQYARDKGLNRMMASVWHYASNPAVRPLLWPTVNNSILYFNNPDTEIPAKPEIQLYKDGQLTKSAKPGDTLTLCVSPAGKETEFDIYLTNEMLRKNVINVKSDKPEVTWKIPENIKQGLWTIQGYSKREDNYLLHATLEGILYIGDKPIPEKRNDGTFISVDFAENKSFKHKKQYVLLNGTSKTNLGIIERDAVLDNGILKCKKGGMLIGRSLEDTEKMSHDKTVMVEFKINQFPSSWAGVLSWGHFGNGFRIIVWEKKLFVQLFGAGENNGKIFLVSKNKLKIGKKYQAVFTINNKEATLYLNGVEQAKATVYNPNPASKIECLAIGCGFMASMCHFFDGDIYRFALWDKYVDLKTVQNYNSCEIRK